MPGFSKEEATVAINLNVLADQIIENRDGFITDVNRLEADVAQAEADGNRKTRIYAFMDMTDDDDVSQVAFTEKLEYCRQLKAAMDSIKPPKKEGAE